jgi:hypothetical protein
LFHTHLYDMFLVFQHLALNTGKRSLNTSKKVRTQARRVRTQVQMQANTFCLLAFRLAFKHFLLAFGLFLFALQFFSGLCFRLQQLVVDWPQSSSRTSRTQFKPEPDLWFRSRFGHCTNLNLRQTSVSCGIADIHVYHYLSQCLGDNHSWRSRRCFQQCEGQVRGGVVDR